MIGDPITVGSPFTTVPDGVRYSKQLRDLYLYRAMVSIIEGAIKQVVGMPDAEASLALQKLFPNYIIEDDLTLDVADDIQADLTRRPAWVYGVYMNSGGSTQFRKESLSRLYSVNTNIYREGYSDPMYALVVPQALGVSDAYQNGILRLVVPPGYMTSWGASLHRCLYLPTPFNPATQVTTEVLDFEPMHFDTVLKIAKDLAMIDAQEIVPSR